MAAVKQFTYGPMTITVDPDQAEPVSATFVAATVAGVSDLQLALFIQMCQAAQTYVNEVRSAEANADAAISNIDGAAK